MNKVLVGIGSNIGNREENISLAVHSLELLPSTTVIAGSSLYETKPFDVRNCSDRAFATCTFGCLSGN
jgi:7,8-dihydro-6-hydroxymethylpterin-pyrophosphokinase